MILILLVPLLAASQSITTDMKNDIYFETLAEKSVILNGVIDRFENNQSIILLEEINEQTIVDQVDLPHDAMEGTWLIIEYEDGNLINIQSDQKKTMQNNKEVDDLIMKLK